MRIIALVTAATIASVGLTYNFMGKDTASEQPQAAKTGSEAAPTPQAQDDPNKLAGILERYQQIHREQLERNQLQQVRMTETLATLDTRLRSLETAMGEQSTAATISDNVDRAMDEAVSDSETGASGPPKVGEADVGHWMDEMLDVGYVDQESTQLATHQAENSVAKVPNVNLDDMRCGDGFCRATFSHENGEEPAIEDIFGEPPFLNEGFTIHEPDGRVVLYFIQPGESLEDFRNEVRDSQLDLSWQ